MKPAEIKTTMTGKEYLTYCKYKDEKIQKTNKEINEHFKKFSFHYIALFFCVILISFIYSLATYTEPVKNTLEENILWLAAFLVICLGMSWVIHGVGFVLVKR